MANLKTFSGFPIQNLTSDPVPYAQALADNPYAGAWGSGANMNTTSQTHGRGGAGSTHSTSLAFGGAPGGTGATESYNGTAWTELNDLNNARGYVVGMGTNTAALAVGGNPPATAGYTEVWNGSSWTEVADLTRGPTSPQSAAYMMGSGSSTSGLVYGGDEGATNKSALTESWNGSAWTEVNDLNTSRSYGAGTGTSNTAALCLSGFNWTPGIAGSPLVEQWNGSSWTEIADVNGRGRAGASCQGSVTATIMFGGSPNNSTNVANTESWDGSAWTEVNDLSTARNGLGGTGVSTNALAFGGLTPSASAATEEWTFSGLNPATTPAADYSDAIVGQMYYNSTSGQFKTVNDGGAPIGTWSSVANMNTARGRLGGFGSATAAIGAGGVLPPNGVSNSVESWNGTAWTEVAEINTSRQTSHFQFGTSTNGIMAGGATTGPGTPTLAVVEEWNGSAWTEVGDLNKNKANGAASGTYTAGVIFGGFTFPGAPPTFAILGETETWNGSAWTEVNDMNTARDTNAAAIGGPSTATITFGRANATPDSIVESWDGTNWTEVGDLNEGRESPGGAGTQTAAMAFGGTPNAALNEIWNGTSWTEANDLGTGRSQHGNAGTSNTSALAFGGANPGYTNVAEQFTAADFEIKTMTTS
jgi:hypothetical protein